MSKLLVLSDLHLWGPEDPLYRALLKFISTKINSGDKFFIVGDLFDLFIGNKAVFRNRYHDLIQAIRSLEKSDVEVFYIEGNHDFQLENLFDSCPHVKVYTNAINYEWNGRKFHFCHGDRINTKDYGYQAFRLFTRSFITQGLIEVIPGRLLDRIGRAMSDKSRSYHVEPDKQVIHAFRNYACDMITKGYDFVVMGHSHYMDDIKFRVGSHEGQYTNVGFPRQHRRYLEIDSNSKFFQLKTFEDLILPVKVADL